MINQFPEFQGARVLVIGDVMLDRYWYGPTARISPEAPVPVVRIQRIENRPGGAANVALNLASLGVQVTLLGVCGDDEAGRLLQQKLEAAQVTTRLHLSKHPTIVKLRILSLQQQLLRLDFEEALQQFEQARLLAEAQAIMGTMDAVVLSDYGKGTLSQVQAYIQLARQHRIPVLVDPKGNSFSHYQYATLLTPNYPEFEQVVGQCADERALITKGKQLLEQLHLEALLVTRGAQGMTLLRHREEELHLPAHAREVYDVTGAGDTVIAVLAAALAKQMPLAEATYWANLAASLVVTKLGAATVALPELRRAHQQNAGLTKGSMTEEQLAIAVADAKAQGERVVFTNGCFDILHAGHVQYLQQAKQLGDRLIVAVNSDESVKRLKGAERPVNTLTRRMTVLAELASVDWVVAFDDDTPHRLLRLLQPDILVKGGDYTIEQVVGAEVVQEYGGQVKVLDLIPGCSTTALIDQIRT